MFKHINKNDFYFLGTEILKIIFEAEVCLDRRAIDSSHLPQGLTLVERENLERIRLLLKKLEGVSHE